MLNNAIYIFLFHKKKVLLRWTRTRLMSSATQGVLERLFLHSISHVAQTVSERGFLRTFRQY